VEVDHNYYSVPYQLAKRELDVRLTTSIVEVLFKGKRVASHKRSYGKGKYSTLKDHMPASHRRYAEWTPSRILNWAKSIGPDTARLADAIMDRLVHNAHKIALRGESMRKIAVAGGQEGGKS
jgi:transposase